jgi:hypothetical protein
MPDNGTKNNDTNKIITETYSSKGQDFLFFGGIEREQLLEQHPMNKALERPIDWEVLNKIQFYNQLSCLAGDDLDDRLFRLKEPYHTQMEFEFSEEMRRAEAECASDDNQLNAQEGHGDGNGIPQDRVFGGGSDSEGGTNV